jgi:hypothetical protein
VHPPTPSSYSPKFFALLARWHSSGQPATTTAEASREKPRPRVNVITSRTSRDAERDAGGKPHAPVDDLCRVATHLVRRHFDATTPEPMLAHRLLSGHRPRVRMGCGPNTSAAAKEGTRTPKTYKSPGQRPVMCSVELRGIEPLTFSMRTQPDMLGRPGGTTSEAAPGTTARTAGNTGT